MSSSKEHTSVKDFMKSILNKSFLFYDNEYFCNNVKVVFEKIAIFTNDRTIVIYQSDVSKISICQTSEKNEHSEKSKNKNVEYRRVLTDEEKSEIKRKYFSKNMTTVRPRYTTEEDALILSVRLNILEKLLGRKYSTLAVRRYYIKNKISNSAEIIYE